MATYDFTDSNGVKREIKITFASIFHVAAETGYDLLNPGIEQKGEILSETLLNDPAKLALVIAALCHVKTEDDFFSALDGRAYAEAEAAFWNAYSDFFAQAGRDWLVVAIQKSLETKARAEETAYQTLLNLQSPTSSDLSPSPESPKDGKTKLSGNSQDSPTPLSETTQAQERKSYAPSTTPTSPEEKTSEVRETSTRSRKPRVEPK